MRIDLYHVMFGAQLYIHSNEFQNGGWKQTWEDMDINTFMVNAMLTSFRRLDGLDNFL